MKFLLAFLLTVLFIADYFSINNPRPQGVLTITSQSAASMTFISLLCHEFLNSKMLIATKAYYL